MNIPGHFASLFDVFARGKDCFDVICLNLKIQYIFDRRVKINIFLFLSVCMVRHLALPVMQCFKPIIDNSNIVKALYGILPSNPSSSMYTPIRILPQHTNAHMLTRLMRRQVLPMDGNQMIHERLCANEHFIAGRGGDAELLIVEDIINHVPPRARQWPRRHSGIYPETPESLQVFGDIYYQAMRSLGSRDLFAFFDHRIQVEDIVLPLTLSKSVGLIHEDALSPFFFPVHPWSGCLRNKTVLIVHPFVDTIKCQISRREFIFPRSRNILPPFSVKYVKSFQCIGEGKRNCSGGKSTTSVWNSRHALGWPVPEWLQVPHVRHEW
jgi:hypothetical protein